MVHLYMTTHLLGSTGQMTVAIERKVDLLSKEAISKVLAAEAEAGAIRERAEADARGMVEACEKTCAEEQTAALTAAADELDARLDMAIAGFMQCFFIIKRNVMSFHKKI